MREMKKFVGRLVKFDVLEIPMSSFQSLCLARAGGRRKRLAEPCA